jgi:hypothetical protein
MPPSPQRAATQGGVVMRGPVVGGVGRIAYASAVPCARCGAFTAFS